MIGGKVTRGIRRLGRKMLAVPGRLLGRTRRIVYERRGRNDVAPLRDESAILIIKADGIGDYLLFRPVLRELVKTDLLRGKRVTLCGMADVRELAETLDGDCFQEFIPVPFSVVFSKRDAFWDEKRRICEQLAAGRFAIAIHPTFSRTVTTDEFARASHATRIIGFDSDTQNLSECEKRRTDRYYTELVAPIGGYQFEFHRYCEMLRHVAGRRIGEVPFHSPPPPAMMAKAAAVRKHFGSIVFFIGGRLKYRRWPAAKYADLAKRCIERFGRGIVIVGGGETSTEAKSIAGQFPGAAVDLAGSTSLVETAALMATAPLIVSNEGFAPHMAANFDTPCVTISHCPHMGRFHPYPAAVFGKGITVYPFDTDPGDPANLKKFYHSYSNREYAVDTIGVDDVWSAVERLAPLASW